MKTNYRFTAAAAKLELNFALNDGGLHPTIIIIYKLNDNLQNEKK